MFRLVFISGSLCSFSILVNHVFPIYTDSGIIHSQEKKTAASFLGISMVPSSLVIRLSFYLQINIPIVAFSAIGCITFSV